MLDALRNQLKQGSGTGLSAMLAYAKKRAIAEKKKTKLSSVKVNRAIKVAEKAGMIVTDINVQPDGSFNLSVAEKGKSAKTAVNPWDEVL